jgi:hypothetical protein
MSTWVKKLDEFINRQGIVSAELCVVVDNIENELKDLRAQLEKQEAINAELIECVDFYSDEENWSKYGECIFTDKDIEDYTEIDWGCDLASSEEILVAQIGGKKARQTLARVKEMEKYE